MPSGVSEINEDICFVAGHVASCVFFLIKNHDTLFPFLVTLIHAVNSL